MSKYCLVPAQSRTQYLLIFVASSKHVTRTASIPVLRHHFGGTYNGGPICKEIYRQSQADTHVVEYTRLVSFDRNILLSFSTNIKLYRLRFIAEKLRKL